MTSESQENVLRALGRRSMSLPSLASSVDGRLPVVQRTVDALIRRSLVTITPLGRYMATERGLKKVGGVS